MDPGWLLPELPHFETPLHSPCLCSPSEGFGFPYGELPCVSCVSSLCLATEMVLFQLRELLFGSQRLQVWGDSRLESLIASVARLVVLTSQLCRGIKASGQGLGGAYNPVFLLVALLLKPIR
ncbi:hypothetical protein Bca4012_049681 [Brassica carinata]